MREPGIATQEAVELAPGLRRLTAPNASAMTGPGTNSYIIGHGPYAVVDPAVADQAHLQRLLAVCDHRVDSIWLTHRHPDHAKGAAWLASQTGAAIAAWPKTTLGSHDHPVTIDRTLMAGQRLEIGGMTAIAHHTPGHASDHVAFELPALGYLLAGDVLMTGSSIVILPPDGDMGSYLHTLSQLAHLDISCIAPGHGTVMSQAGAVIERAICHRHKRERQIQQALSAHQAQASLEVAQRLYTRLDDKMMGVADRQVQAHLLHLAEQGQARQDDAGNWLLA